MTAIAFKPGAVEITSARREDASDIAMLTDMASHGLAAHFWATSAERRPGVSLLEIGRERARRDEGDFSWRNAWIARLDGQPAGLLLGYALTSEMAEADLSDMPRLVRPLLELERRASPSWYVNVLAVYPEYRGRGIGGLLLGHAISLARNAGAAEISLIVEDICAGARKLYREHGFVERETRRFEAFPAGPEAKEWILMMRELHERSE